MSRFHSTVKVQYVNGKTWILLEDFGYSSDLLQGDVIVPEGFLTDFASVPRGLWNVLPKTDYGQAAVVHDYLCRYGNGLSRKMADRVFEEALILLGAPRWKVRVMYWGVRLGAAWSRLF